MTSDLATVLPDGQVFVGGRWRPGTGEVTVDRNPADGAVNREFATAGVDDVDEAVAAGVAAAADPAWRDLLPHERARYLHRIADGIEANVERISPDGRHGQDPRRDCGPGAVSRGDVPLLRGGVRDPRRGPPPAATTSP